MPIYEFRFDDGEVVEEIFSWRDVPATIERDGRVARRIPSAFNGKVPDLAAQARMRAQGVVPYERGMDQDAKRAKEHQQRKRDEQRRKVIADTLAGF